MFLSHLSFRRLSIINLLTYVVFLSTPKVFRPGKLNRNMKNSIKLAANVSLYCIKYLKTIVCLWLWPICLIIIRICVLFTENVIMSYGDVRLRSYFYPLLLLLFNSQYLKKQKLIDTWYSLKFVCEWFECLCCRRCFNKRLWRWYDCSRSRNFCYWFLSVRIRILGTVWFI